MVMKFKDSSAFYLIVWVLNKLLLVFHKALINITKHKSNAYWLFKKHRKLFKKYRKVKKKIKLSKNHHPEIPQIFLPNHFSMCISVHISNILKWCSYSTYSLRYFPTYMMNTSHVNKYSFNKNSSGCEALTLQRYTRAMFLKQIQRYF